MTKRVHWALLAVAACLLFAGAAVAEPAEAETAPAGVAVETTPKGCDQIYDESLFASELDIALASYDGPRQPRAADRRDGDRGNALGKCYVRVRCGNGSTISCSGSFCFGSDQVCPADTGGYCYGTSTGWRYCPDCPNNNCSATADCSGAGGGTVSCNGSSGDCFAIDGCYAHCDGNYNFCPDPDFPCPF